MMPLCTTATLSVAIGCAFFSIGWPCVAQRVWPMPIVPRTGSRSRRATRFDIFPRGGGALEGALDGGGDPRRIVAAIFEPLEARDQLVRDRFLRDDSDD